MTSELPPDVKESIVLVGGSTHPELTKAIAGRLGLALGELTLKSHPDSELYVGFNEPEILVGRHVIAVQPHVRANGLSAYDSFQQHLQIIEAATRAGADQRTAVAPILAGARQNNPKPGESGTAELTLDLMETVGTSHIFTVDMHDPSMRHNFFGGFEHLTVEGLLRAVVRNKMTEDAESYRVVAADRGGFGQAKYEAEQLGVGAAWVPKERLPGGGIRRPDKVEGLEDTTCVIFEDMIVTGETLGSAVHTLFNSGAKEIYVAASHLYTLDHTLELLQGLPLTQIITSNTMPINEAKNALGDRLVVVSADDVLAQGIAAHLTGQPIPAELYSTNSR
jgi:ribose-phosphate pyrophosphokinase